MRLTVQSDYALRVLMYAASCPDRLVTIDEIARGYGISENHLMKVVQKLAHAGFLVTVRGRGGGLRLARPAAEITVGAVIRATEEDFALVECFGSGNRCRLTPICRLKPVLGEAIAAYLSVLDRSRLSDLVALPRRLDAFLAPVAE
ncbi:Rrf2 family transcriptional regulator [Chelatococcus sp. SYSU_G07232]|uniref:Rrf2 family transcriptional regulator n=1 Tax=Chelatococcus albus TaxID=3047466 RepID=A0ABT7AI12_9HYPH|nr:Rrf2 family transcriptional regulator [Chelatococcus sp. SYSU_G07232]MDJ1158998.1 Rrf2 family transcriptional regulator [Chelatococcus sp. SYSU_G07232]